MLVVRSFLATALLLSAVQSVAKELAYYDSLRLVGAMRDDERMLRLARTQRSTRSKLSDQDVECLDRLEYPEFTAVAARAISDNMTSAEVLDALGYFQSASGRKFVKRELGILGETQFTTTDQAELERFKQRPAGRKLFRDLILNNDAIMAEVAERVDRHLEGCAFYRRSEVERELTEKSCEARPVASSDNACLATYGAEGNGRKARRASVEINCRRDGRVLTSRISLPKPEAPIALRWTTDRDLEILVDGKVKNSPPVANSSANVSFASRKKDDPPLLECMPQMRGNPMLANSLPAMDRVGAWRTYARPGMCLMTARVLKQEIPGADGDVLLQFRRQNPAVAPFSTTELALVVQIDQQSEQPLIVNFGQKRLTLMAHPPQQKHMLSGMTVEVLLEGLRSRPADLTVRSAGGPSYSIPVRGLDFDFAYSDFSECLGTLQTT
jgi:hypothetical protein